MFNYREWNRVNRLIRDGNQFLSTRALNTEISQVRIWLAAVSDTVLPRLPTEGSKLRTEFEELLKLLQEEKKDNAADEKLEDNKNIKQQKLKDIVLSAIRILEYTRGLPEPSKTFSEESREYEKPLELNET